MRFRHDLASSTLFDPDFHQHVQQTSSLRASPPKAGAFANMKFLMFFSCSFRVFFPIQGMGARSGSLPIVGNLINCAVTVYLKPEDGHGDIVGGT